MKKLFILGIAVAGLTLVSCKKERTCECTTTTAGISATVSTTIKDTKKNAEEACDALNSSTSLGGVTSETVCELK